MNPVTKLYNKPLKKTAFHIACTGIQRDERYNSSTLMQDFI